MKLYAEYAIEGVANRNQFYVNGSPKLTGKSECYRSLFLFPASELGKPSPELLTADAFVFDFDNPNDIELARKSARNFVWYLVDNKIPSQYIRISFSGSKGFHVVLSTKVAQANVVKEADEYIERYRRFALKLAEGFSYADLSIYTPRRLIRVINTRNEKTGLYKIPITYDEFCADEFNLPYLDLAAQPRILPQEKVEIEPIEEYVELFHSALEKTPNGTKRDYVELLKRDIPEGERHNTLVYLVGHLRAKGLREAEVLELLRGWNQKLTTPLPDKEVVATIKSLFSKADKHPSRKPLILLSGSDIVGEKEKPTNYLIKRLVAHPSLNILFGEEGSAKSILMANLAVSVSAARDKWLSWDVGKTGHVIYVDAEMDIQSVKNRFIRMVSVLSEQQKPLLSRLTIITESPLFKELKNELISLCEAYKPVLIIFDDLYFLHLADENKASDMKGIMQEFRELRDRFNATVFVVHHTRKTIDIQPMDNQQMRGSQVLGAIVDSAFQLKYSLKEQGKVLFKPTKFRHIPIDERETHLLSLDKDTLWLTDEGVVEERDHLIYQQSEITPDEIFGAKPALFIQDIKRALKERGKTESQAHWILSKWVKKGLIVRTPMGTYMRTESLENNNDNGESSNEADTKVH